MWVVTTSLTKLLNASYFACTKLLSVRRDVSKNYLLAPFSGGRIGRQNGENNKTAIVP